MGPYLTVPNKAKEAEDGGNSYVTIHLLNYNYLLKVQFGASCMQGWRNTQEDAHICNVEVEGGGCLFGVFDGHGGMNMAIVIELCRQ